MIGNVPRPGIIVVLALALMAAGCVTHPSAAVPEGDAKRSVVAKVNGVALTGAALDEIMERMRSSKHAPLTTDTGDLRRRALEQLVIQELAVQEAVRQGMQVNEEVLNAAMNKLTTSLGHGEGFEAFLKERRLTAEEVRSQVERRLLLEGIYEKEVRAKVAVSPEEVRQEYDLNKGRYISPERATVTDIAFTQKHGTQVLLKKAEEVIAALKADKDLDPRAIASGDLFTVQDRDIDSRREPLLFGAVRGLKEGEHSGLLETPEGAHILKLIRITTEKQLTFEEAQDLIEKRLRGIAEMRRLVEWQESLKKSAVIELTGDTAPPREKQETEHP